MSIDQVKDKQSAERRSESMLTVRHSLNCSRQLGPAIIVQDEEALEFRQLKVVFRSLVQLQVVLPSKSDTDRRQMNRFATGSSSSSHVARPVEPIWISVDS